MMSKAAAHGLELRHSAAIDGDVNGCPIHDSYAEMAHGVYKFITFGQEHYRLIGAEPLDTGDAVRTTINETIDASVFERWRNDPKYRPKNLLEWAGRRAVDPSTLNQSVRANDATAIGQES